MSQFAEIESVSKYDRRNLSVRVWRKEWTVENGYPGTQTALNDILDGMDPDSWTPVGVIQAVVRRMDRINAIEVTEKMTHQSVVVYPEWP